MCAQRDEGPGPDLDRKDCFLLGMCLGAVLTALAHIGTVEMIAPAHAQEAAAPMTPVPAGTPFGVEDDGTVRMLAVEDHDGLGYIRLRPDTQAQLDRIERMLCAFSGFGRGPVRICPAAGPLDSMTCVYTHIPQPEAFAGCPQ